MTSIDLEATYAPTLLICRVSTWPTISEQADLRERLQRDGHIQSHTVVLIDIRNVSALPNAEEVAFAMAGARERTVRPRRVAYLVGSREQEQLAQQMQVLGSTYRVIRAFFSEADALKWLLLADVPEAKNSDAR